jgi:RNA polymerase sigma-70 factor (ECF subfamily)
LRTLDDPAHDDDALAVACPQPQPDQVAEQRELLGLTLSRIRSLPEGLREALRLRAIEEQPTEAVCKTLGISEANLFVRLHRARKQLLS